MGILLFSGVLFLASLTQPAFYLDQENYDAWADSKSLVLLGWMGMLTGGWENGVWWANPLYFLSLVLLATSKREATLTSTAAALLALLFSTFDTIVANENGGRVKVSSLELGYWLWLTSLLVLAIGSYGYFEQRKRLEEIG